MRIKLLLLIISASILFISCEERIFLEKTPDIIHNDGMYYFDPAGYGFSKVILSKAGSVIELTSCRESASELTVFNNEESGYYEMFVINGIDTVFSREAYIGKTDLNSLKITVLDVKQGDSFIIEPPYGKSSVMDGGYGSLGYYSWQDGSNKTLLDELNRQNISDLKYIIETHHDKDHYGGLYDVINAGSVTYEDYLTYGDSLPVFGDTLYFSENIKGVMLHYGDSTVTGENNSSIAVKMIYENFEMIFTGDIEESAESAILSRSLLDPSEDYEILKVAHHGSSSSSTQGFLNAVVPLYAIISVGSDNDYGHPQTEVLDRLKEIKSCILRTDRNSTIGIFTDGKSFQISYSL